MKKIKPGELDIKNMKVRVNCWIDGVVIKILRDEAERQGVGYQTLLNQKLREAVLGDSGNSLESRVQRLESLLSRLDPSVTKKKI